MILLSGKHDRSRGWVWYAKFMGLDNRSKAYNYPFFDHKEFLDDLLQFTANWLYERIRANYPNMKKKDARMLVIEIFKQDKTMMVFDGYDDNHKDTPILYIEFYYNSIVQELIDEKGCEFIRFKAELWARYNGLDKEYILGCRPIIVYSDAERTGTIIPGGSKVALWNKNLTEKVGIV